MTDRHESMHRDDAIILARLPELVQLLEEAAYALIRNGDAKNGNALFLAVVAAQGAVETIAANRNSDLENRPGTNPTTKR